MSDLPIEVVDIKTLELHPMNPRQGDTGAIVESITENEWYGTITVQRSTNRILVGNHRVKALQEMGVKKVPVWYVDVDDTKAKQILLADNRANDKANYNEKELADLLVELAGKDNLLGTLYDGDDLDTLLHDLDMQQDNDTEPSDVRPKNPVTKLGDRWEIGNHVVVCGDATNPDMYPKEYDLLVTDPPYGVSYGDKNRFLNMVRPANRLEEPIEGDHQTPEEMSTLWNAAFSAARKFAKPGASYYVTGPQGGDLLLLLLLSLRDSGFPLRHMLIWAKNNHVLGRADYNYKHEPIIFGWVEGTHTFNKTGDTSVWEIDKPMESKLHPTMKPVELYERAMRNSSLEDQLVLDPFGGSGTCIVAAHNKDRKAHLIEIDPGYCDIILKRAQEHTGLVPTRAGEPHDFMGVKSDSSPK